MLKPTKSFEKKGYTTLTTIGFEDVPAGEGDPGFSPG
jgi:hypothetical protein